MTKRIVRPWTKEETLLLRGTGDIAGSELVERLPGRTACAINAKRVRLGVRATPALRSRQAKAARANVDPANVFLVDQSLTLEDLPIDSQQLLIAGMFGDGGISSNGKCARPVYKFSHCAAQADYARWKCERLACLKARIFPSKRRGCGGQTTSHPLLGALKKDIYRGHSKKRFPSVKWAERLDDLGFLLWWLDDGHRPRKRSGGRYRRGMISCVRATRDEVEPVVEVFNRRYGVTVECRTNKWKNKLNAPRVYITNDAFDTVMPVWRQTFKTYDLPECMRYKIEDHDD